jgi:outer membrane protein assembly factor BamB
MHVKPLPLGVLLLVGLLGVGCRRGTGTAAGFEWPRWRGPNGDGISLETGWNPKALEGGAKVLWETDIGMGYSCVAVKGNRLYAFGCFGASNRVSCLNTESGKIIWQYALKSSEEPQSTPAVDGESVYALTNKGILVCLGSQNGKLRWHKNIAEQYGALDPYYGFSTSPVIDGELLLLNANTAGMALNKNTGQLVWESEAPPAAKLVAELGTDNGASYMSPVIYERGQQHYVLVYSWKGLSCLHVMTGEPLWTYRWENYNLNRTPDPVLSGSLLLLADDNKGKLGERFSTLLSLSDAGTEVVWQSRALYSDVCSPIVLAGCIYGVYGGPYPLSSFTSLRCLELESGRLLWEKHPLPYASKEWISLSAADGKLIVLTESGLLRILEATSAGYREISGCLLPKGEKRYMQFRTAPVLCNGRVYCRNFTGELVCVDLRA